MKPANWKELIAETLTDKQKQLRKEGRYDEINLSDEQRGKLGEEICCMIESPSFYRQSNWCS